MTIKTLYIGDVGIPIEVDSSGTFRAEWGDEGPYADKSLERLEDKIIAAVKRDKDRRLIPVSVIDLVRTTDEDRKRMRFGKPEPFTHGYGVVHASLRGKHARNSVWLLVADDGTKFQIGTYGREGQICRLLTATEEAEYELIAKHLSQAARAMEEFRRRVAVDPAELLKS